MESEAESNPEPNGLGLGGAPGSQISEWYASKCDGDWEHMYGVRIETTDNPGWLAQIDADPKDGSAIKGKTGRVEWEYSEGILIGYIEAADGLPELLAVLGDILSANASSDRIPGHTEDAP